MKKVQTKRYWYFTTQEFMGHTMELHPRIPYCASESEPKVKRICVAPTAAHCMSAIGFGYSTSVYVYRTRRRVFAAKAWGVDDSVITHEHFLLRKSRFELVASISPTWVNGLHDRGAFQDRGASKADSRSWHDQWQQRGQVIRAMIKLDPRLAIIKLSDSNFKYPGESMLLGKSWPDRDKGVYGIYDTTRQSELELLGFVKPKPKPAHVVKPVSDLSLKNHMVDYDIQFMYSNQINELTWKPTEHLEEINKNLTNSVYNAMIPL